MATPKLKRQTKRKVIKPKKTMRAHKHTHSFVLEQDGRVTCECDAFMIFTRSSQDAKKVSDWFSAVSTYLRSKNK